MKTKYYFLQFETFSGKSEGQGNYTFGKQLINEPSEWANQDIIVDERHDGAITYYSKNASDILQVAKTCNVTDSLLRSIRKEIPRKLREV